jgi:hypothetical protein
MTTEKFQGSFMDFSDADLPREVGFRLMSSSRPAREAPTGYQL